MARIERVDRGLYRVENNNGSISWQIDYLNPDRKRIRKTFSTKKQAAEERAARVHMMAKGEYGEFVEKKEKKSATLGELLELYRKNYQDQTSFKTAKKFYIQGFREYFKEDTLLSSIEYGDLKTYRNTLKKSLNQHGKILSFSSVNAKMSCLRHMFKEAIEYKMIEQSPFNGGKTLMLEVDNVRERYLEPEEINRLLDKSPLHLQHIIKCGLFSGMRLGNILSLKWSQIRDGHMYVKTKTGKDNFPVSDILAELFEQIKGSQKPVNGNVVDLNGRPVERAGIKSEYVFTYQGGNPSRVSRPPSRKPVRELVWNMAGIKRTGLHSTRCGTHTALILQNKGHTSGQFKSYWDTKI
jgi:integrase